MPAGSYQQRSAGRSNIASSHNYSSAISPVGSTAKQQNPASLATRLNDEDRAGGGSPSSPSRITSRKKNSGSRTMLPRTMDTNMGSYSSTTTLPPTQRSGNSHAKLHKRGSSGSSLPGPPSPLVNSQYPTPFATYEEPFPELVSTPPTNSTPKIKPYLRKISASKQEQEDQGRLDLSKSTSEHDRLAGLGIQDFAARSAQDVSFAHATRRGPHARTTSVGSQMSTGSGTYRPNQPFMHPMRQTPRPYTPPTGSSSASLVHEDEAQEGDDVVDDDFRLGHGFRSRRSVSISSVPAAAPTPLSQSHTADELGIVPKLTSPSQTNLSIKSGRSGKSSKSRLGRSRRDTSRSFDLPRSPSSRTSFDKAFSFVSRKSDLDAQTRDERIREARRKFEEKEASKDRRREKEARKQRESEESQSVKKNERQRRKSEASERARITKHAPSDDRSSPRKGRRDEVKEDEKFRARSYDDTRPANVMSLPRTGREAGMSEKTPQVRERKAPTPQSGWVRFSAWLQTRMLSCGGER